MTVNCVGCYRIDHCNSCTIFIVRFISQVNRRFTDFRRFPRTISVKSIVAVMSQMRDTTRNLAIATKMRKSFATNFGNKLDPLHSCGDARLRTLLWSQGDAFMGIVSEPTKFERIHQLLQYTLSSSCVAMCVWSSFANLSISRITSSVRPNSIMVIRNHVSRINRSWMLKNCRFLHFFGSWFAVWFSWSPSFFPYLWPCGRPFLM